MCYRLTPSQLAENRERSSRQQAQGNTKLKERGEHQEPQRDDVGRREERVEEVETE